MAIAKRDDLKQRWMRHATSGPFFVAHNALIRSACENNTFRHSALCHGMYHGRKLPRSVLPELRSVGYSDAEQPQQWGTALHCNESLELTFQESGSLGFAIDRHESVLQPNELLIARPWQWHSFGDPCITAGRIVWLNLDLGMREPHEAWHWPEWIVLSRKDIQELTNILRHNEHPVWPADRKMQTCFQELRRAVDQPIVETCISVLVVRINELFLLLLETLRSKSPELDASLSSAKRTVRLFWNDLLANDDALMANWTVPGMARQCGLKRAQFASLTRELVNLAPAQYLFQCRMERAARQLRDSEEVSVTELALAHGFSSSQYFATAFRRMFGCSPRDYREQREP
jgi:AraC-like DNA-binding protein